MCALAAPVFSTANMSESALDPNKFAGVLGFITPSSNPDQSLDQLDQQAVMDDLEGEEQTGPWSRRP